mmetsp:Transcript_17498/g.54485  ORF Transcript_17498/g.54485 Transcript_17498/m.54485 type:complete len:84 (+) Transcript_17498:207-458(+)
MCIGRRVGLGLGPSAVLRVQRWPQMPFGQVVFAVPPPAAAAMPLAPQLELAPAPPDDALPAHSAMAVAAQLPVPPGDDDSAAL